MITMTRRRSSWLTLAGVTVIVGGAAPDSYAHVTLATGEARANAYYKGVLQVPHGCNGEATQVIRVQIPEGVIGVKPMPKPGWTLSITRGAFAKTYRSHGKDVTEGPKEIVWSGGSLSDDNFDEFTFAGFIVADFQAGQTVFFPTIQQCTKSETRWIEIPAAQQNAHDLKAPAPMLRIIADNVTDASAQIDHSKMGHVATAAMSGNDTFKVGDMVVSAPWTRATPGGAKIAGGYLSLKNNGSSPDRLVSATAEVAGRVEIHEMSMSDGVMKMRPLDAGLAIKPGETVELKPGGFHMMFMDITQPLKSGDDLKATLKFEKAGSLDVSFKVNAIGAAAAPEHKH